MSEPQNTPYVIKETPGKKAWCSCRKSQNLPYCDGAHKGSEDHPIVVNLEEEKTIAWCGCHKTATPPYCDGSHKA